MSELYDVRERDYTVNDTPDSIPWRDCHYAAYRSRKAARARLTRELKSFGPHWAVVERTKDYARLSTVGQGHPKHWRADDADIIWELVIQ